MKPLAPVPPEEIAAARERIADLALRSPLLRLDADAPAEVFVKLENLQPVGCFKVRGAGNALRSMPAARRAGGVFTVSAGNMAQGLAYAAAQLGVACAAVVPDSAPQAKLGTIERLGASIVKVPFDEWWQAIVTHHFDGLPGRLVHPVADRDVIAGNGTIGPEILEDLPDVDAIVIPWGGGGLSCGIASAVRAMKPAVRIYAAEVETAAPLKASLAAGEPRSIHRTPSFVDGIGGGGVLAEMWPLGRALIDDSLVVTLEQVAGAIRLLARRGRVIAEGAGAAPVAAALAGLAGEGRIACVVSGGNIDAATLAAILAGGVP